MKMNFRNYFSHYSFVAIVLILGLFISCKSEREFFHTNRIKKKDLNNPANSQRALAIWLMNQPQEVRDAFKQDFLFKGDDFKLFVDTISK
ncbi:MAG: hypothetical protein ACKO5Y_00805 [Bacteroidota bacterium]